MNLLNLLTLIKYHIHIQQAYIAAVFVSSLVITSAMVIGQDPNEDDEPQGKDHSADSSIYAPDWVCSNIVTVSISIFFSTRTQ